MSYQFWHTPMLRIAEIFRSVQGEGFLTGTDSVFVRTSGCNLRCTWCDTDYASWAPEGANHSLESLIATVAAYETEHVVITGGEPLLPRDIVPFTATLKERGHHITIETAATVDRPVQCDLISISPKRANSTPTADDPRDPTGKWRHAHESTRHNPDVIRRFVGDYPYQFKFVCGSIDDVEDVVGYLDEFQEVDPARVLLMPEGTDAATLNSRLEWLAPVAAKNGFGITRRLHVELFGNTRGT